MKILNVDDGYFIYGLLFSLSNRIQKTLDGAFEDLTIKQHFLLIGLSMFDSPPTLKETADLIGCSYQNIKTMAKSLEKKGFLNIKKDQTDNRKLLLVLTKKCKEVEGLYEDDVKDFMSKMYENISKEDLEITLKTLMRMDRNLGGIIE